MTIPRVRFAPSPTGYLHVGGARTALFNYLFARHHGGAFLLRIEDTDRERSSDEMTGQILEAMAWLGLEVDEPPVHQGAGLERHAADVGRLLEAGLAYRCFASKDELDEMRATAREDVRPFRYRESPEYDEAEAQDRAADGEPHAVFFEVPAEDITFEDAVHGPTTVPGDSLDDFVILRSDGTPVYNMAVVSDDVHMRITHVIRGDDHLSNTPKQILIYRGLGAVPPVFAHVPMILGPDGKRLSKRHGAASVEAYREEGILPEALVNFLALLGWSPGDDREVMRLPELVEAFTLDRILKKAGVFDAKKLEWLNGKYLDVAGSDRLVPLVLEVMDDARPGHRRRRSAAFRGRGGSAEDAGPDDPGDRGDQPALLRGRHHVRRDRPCRSSGSRTRRPRATSSRPSARSLPGPTRSMRRVSRRVCARSPGAGRSGSER